MPLPVIAGTAAGLLAVWAAYSYNFFVHARQKVREDRNGLDRQLKLRHDLVPRVNDLVRAYAEQEHEAMRAAAARRCQAIAASKVAEVEQMENALSEELSNVLAIAETYPQLKSSQQFGAIWRELERVEAAVQEAKDRYNAAAEFYNRRARRIPGGLVAAWMKPRSFDCLGLERVDFDADLTRMGEFAA